MAEPRNRYSNVSVFLHWSIALLIVANVALGWIMSIPEGRLSPGPFALHQSVGVTILLLSLVRLGWRLANPWVPLPGNMALWEKALARFSHAAFYVAIIGIPLLGWLAVSSFGNGPNFWGLEIPRLPIAESRDQGESYGYWHGVAVYSTLVLLALHVAGALKHTYIQKNQVLGHMIPAMLKPDADNPASVRRARAPRRKEPID